MVNEPAFAKDEPILNLVSHHQGFLVLKSECATLTADFHKLLEEIETSINLLSSFDT